MKTVVCACFEGCRLRLSVDTEAFEQELRKTQDIGQAAIAVASRDSKCEVRLTHRGMTERCVFDSKTLADFAA